jgi:hypothetical protein
MRRFWFLLLAVTVILVIALPAGAGKPPKTPPAAPVAATLEGNPMWVHEAGDVISYSVTVENKTRSEIVVEIAYPDGTTQVTIQPKVPVSFPNLFSDEVTHNDIDSCLADEDFCDLFAEVTLRHPDGGDVIVVAETSTLVDPVDECVFEDGDGNPAVTEAGLCIWKPTTLGEWQLAAVPEPVPTRPTNLMMTMRDAVPGNWCTLEDGTGGAVQERWLKSSESVVLDVYLPENGVCLLGGHGMCTEPDCYFAVGNPASFYLYTTFDAYITVTVPDD